MLVEFKNSRPWTVVFWHGRFRLSHSPMLWILWLKLQKVRESIYRLNKTHNSSNNNNSDGDDDYKLFRVFLSGKS